MKKYAILFTIALVGCAVTKEKNSYIDKTLTVPNKYFEESDLSKSIISGSSSAAKASNCTFMQRYKISTNADFISSLIMFKYRAASFGAERIVVVKHEEIDATESKIYIDDGDVILNSGTSLKGADYYTTIVGDLYDCSCVSNACTTPK
jgi:hypothetical protein